MCVKEFLGYNCGHCSIPFLRQCPLSLSNPIFPICKYVAERPVFTNEYCHPCSRVIWNMKVLKEEEEHRARHLGGDCMCEVVFEGEEREQRHQTRSFRAKEKGREVIMGEHMGHKSFDADGEGLGSGQEAIEEQMRMDVHIAGGEAGPSYPRPEWEPQAQMAAYKYVGYYVGQGQLEANEPEQYAMAVGVYGIQEQFPVVPLAETGEWQKQETSPQPLPIFNHNENFGGTPLGPRARSAPTENHPELLQIPLVPKMPLVVSSDMMTVDTS